MIIIIVFWWWIIFIWNFPDFISRISNITARKNRNKLLGFGICLFLFFSFFLALILILFYCKASCCWLACFLELSNLYWFRFLFFNFLQHLFFDRLNIGFIVTCISWGLAILPYYKTLWLFLMNLMKLFNLKSLW